MGHPPLPHLLGQDMGQLDVLPVDIPHLLGQDMGHLDAPLPHLLGQDMGQLVDVLPKLGLTSSCPTYWDRTWGN